MASTAIPSVESDAAGELWVRLDGRGAANGTVGGKAAALDRLVALGAPVPTAAVIAVDAYRRVVADRSLSRRLAALGTPAPEHADADRAAVESAFREVALPGDVRRAIHAAFAHAADASGEIAVRSSATAEDLSGASFAGQYRSFVGVTAAEVEDAVRLCWASLWAPPARAYRAAVGTDDDVAMAVIIQRVVPAEMSGVAFTVDPTGEEPNRVRVEVVTGPGERLVSGRTTPQVFHLDRHHDNLRPDVPWFVVEAARWALAVEGAEGVPQDVEWSVEGRRLYVLQARPVTSARHGDGFDTAPVPDATFTTGGVDEMLPGVVPPLLWSINGPLLEDAFVALHRELGLGAAARGPLVGRFRGRCALNLSALAAAAGQVPGGSAAEVERQYTGRVLSTETVGRVPLRQRLARARSGRRALRLRRRLAADAAAFRTAVALALDLTPALADLPADRLVEYRRSLREIARFGYRTEIAVGASAAASYASLERTLGRWLSPGDAAGAVQRVTAGAVGDQAAGCDAVFASEATPGEAPPRPASMAAYGDRTWDEDATALQAALERCKRQRQSPTHAKRAGRAPAVDELLATLTGGRGWRVTRVLTGQVIDVRARLLRSLVRDAASFLHLRETTKATLLRLGGEERRVIRELAGRIGLADGDEWLLTDDELDIAAVEGRVPSAEELTRRRRGLDELGRSELPDVFSGLVALEPPTAEPGGDEPGDELRGWPASPGQLRGVARVVRDLRDAAGVDGGTVLVGRASDPSWTPALLAAGGVVMEQGGPLSHAAIVAREFGIPAVLRVPSATRRIRSGDEVTVDGTTGTVTIVRKAA